MHSGTDPPGEPPTTTPNWSWRPPPPETPAAPKCASHPLFSGPQLSGGSEFDFRAHFCHSAPMETHAFGLRLRAKRPGGPNAISYQSTGNLKVRLILRSGLTR